MGLQPRSVRFRLTLWYVTVLAGIVVAFSGGVYYFVRQSLFAQLDGQLSHDAAILGGMAAEREFEEADDLTEVEQERLIDYFRFQRDGQLPFRSQAWQRAGLETAARQGEGAAPRTVEGAAGEPFRLLSATSIGPGDTSYAVSVARPEYPLREDLSRLRLILAMGLPVAFALAVAGGLFLAGRALSPIQAMAAKARSITADSISERLPVDNPDDELGQLAVVFNDMLSRLQNAFERLRQFTADASHQLRTPLTVIRSVGEVNLRREHDAAAYREAIESILEEADRLARLTENLLMLARLESGPAPRADAPTDISALVNEAVDCLRVLAEEKDQTIRLSLEPDTRAPVDRFMIRQAVINILDNAIRYSPPGSMIFVALSRQEPGHFRISIEDEGPGIPVEERSRIFERFYRMPGSTGAGGDGAGLGLSIAQRAVERNGGHIDVRESGRGGSIFCIVV
jgi:heavy metal sensor kinase